MTRSTLSRRARNSASVMIGAAAAGLAALAAALLLGLEAGGALDGGRLVALRARLATWVTVPGGSSSPSPEAAPAAAATTTARAGPRPSVGGVPSAGPVPRPPRSPGVGPRCRIRALVVVARRARGGRGPTAPAARATSPSSATAVARRGRRRPAVGRVLAAVRCGVGGRGGPAPRRRRGRRRRQGARSAPGPGAVARRRRGHRLGRLEEQAEGRHDDGGRRLGLVSSSSSREGARPRRPAGAPPRPRASPRPRRRPPRRPAPRRGPARLGGLLAGRLLRRPACGRPSWRASGSTGSAAGQQWRRLLRLGSGPPRRHPAWRAAAFLPARRRLGFFGGAGGGLLGGLLGVGCR